MKTKIWFFCCLFASMVIGQTLVVDFGASSGENQYGLAGWSSVTLGPGAQYTANGGGGITMAPGAAQGTDFIRINGTTRNFTKGDKIVVTWYNNSGSRIDYLYPLISFTDTDGPSSASGQPQWYALAADDKEDYYGYGREYVWVPAHGYGKSFYTIVETSRYTNTLPGYISAGPHSLINITTNTTDFQGSLICTKVEIVNADTTPPDIPGNFRITGKTDVSISLAWNPSTDDDSVEYYTVYVNNETWAFTIDTNITIYGFRPATSCSVLVSAKDWSGNETKTTVPLIVTTESWSKDSSLINPFFDLHYCGSFRSPFCAVTGLTFYPSGDPSNTDVYPGSLVAYHPYNEQAVEITIPAPGDATTLAPDALPVATALHQPASITRFGDGLDPVSDVMIFGGITYVPPEISGVGFASFLYSGLQSQAYDKYLTLGAFRADGSTWSTKFGLWWLGTRNGDPYCTEYSAFVFITPEDWANRDFNGNALFAGGGYREYLGPTLTASSPWSGGAYPANQSELAWTRLMKYGNYVGENKFPNSLNGFQKGDNFTGGAWAQLDGGAAYGLKNAVIISQYKSRGKDWYGFPDGLMFYDVIYDKPETHNVNAQRGDFSAGAIRSLMFYDPRQIAEVYSGTRDPYDLQPYAFLDLTPWFYDDRIGVEDWEHTQITGGIATDWQHGYIYVLERKVVLDSQEKKDIIHVFKINNFSVSTEHSEDRHTGFELAPNCPNPFNPSTTIRYRLTAPGFISLKIYDALGKEVATLVNGKKGAGTYSVEWNGTVSSGKKIGSGIYFCQLETAPGCIKRHKMVLMK